MPLSKTLPTGADPGSPSAKHLLSPTESSDAEVKIVSPRRGAGFVQGILDALAGRRRYDDDDDDDDGGGGKGGKLARDAKGARLKGILRKDGHGDGGIAGVAAGRRRGAGAHVKWRTVLAGEEATVQDVRVKQQQEVEERARREQYTQMFKIARLPMLTFEELMIPLRLAFPDLIAYNSLAIVIDVLGDCFEIAWVIKTVREQPSTAELRAQHAQAAREAAAAAAAAAAGRAAAPAARTTRRRRSSTPRPTPCATWAPPFRSTSRAASTSSQGTTRSGRWCRSSGPCACGTSSPTCSRSTTT